MSPFTLNPPVSSSNTTSYSKSSASIRLHILPLLFPDSHSTVKVKPLGSYPSLPHSPTSLFPLLSSVLSRPGPPSGLVFTMPSLSSLKNKSPGLSFQCQLSQLSLTDILIIPILSLNSACWHWQLPLSMMPCLSLYLVKLSIVEPLYPHSTYRQTQMPHLGFHQTHIFVRASSSAVIKI